MKPLLVRRAGDFEKTVFDLSMTVGVVGLYPQTDISAAVIAVLGSAGWWFWTLLIVAGLGGRLVTWRSNRDRMIPDIVHECQAELIVLSILSATWLVYAAGNARLLDDGVGATIPLLFSLSIVVSSVRRGSRIVTDLRKLARAVRSRDMTTTAEVLADPDDEGGDL